MDLLCHDLGVQLGRGHLEAVVSSSAVELDLFGYRKGAPAVDHRLHPVVEGRAAAHRLECGPVYIPFESTIASNGGRHMPTKRYGPTSTWGLERPEPHAQQI